MICLAYRLAHASCLDYYDTYGMSERHEPSVCHMTDFSQSTRRKLLRKHNPFMTMALSARTTIRSSILMQVADYIFSTTMDAYRFQSLPQSSSAQQQK